MFAHTFFHFKSYIDDSRRHFWLDIWSVFVPFQLHIDYRWAIFDMLLQWHQSLWIFSTFSKPIRIKQLWKILMDTPSNAIYLQNSISLMSHHIFIICGCKFDNMTRRSQTNARKVIWTFYWLHLFCIFIIYFSNVEILIFSILIFLILPNFV